MKTIYRTTFFAIALLLTIGCSGGGTPVPPELEKAVSVVRYMTAPKQLSRSGFQAQSSKTPSDFVSYMFSDMGAAEWPYSEEMVQQNPAIGEEAKSIGMPLIPKGVALVPRRPDATKKKQVVIKADDARNMIIVEGYTDPSAKPVMTTEWKFLK